MLPRLAAICKGRWEIGMFLRTLEQNLRINTFVGTKPNRLQIRNCTALVGYWLFQPGARIFPPRDERSGLKGSRCDGSVLRPEHRMRPRPDARPSGRPTADGAIGSCAGVTLMPSRRFSPRVPICDANVCVGHGRDGPSPCGCRAELLGEMDAFGVQRAVVYHVQAERISPVEGNQVLEEWAGDDPRLIPQWMVIPTADSLDQARDLKARNRMRCVRLYDTGQTGLPFRRWAFDPLLSWLDAERIPVWISLPDTDPDALVATLGAYPDLVTVLVGAHYMHALQVRPILRAIPNACLELSRYEVLGEVEALRDEFGAERLVYGSWYPRYAMGPVLFYLHHTDLTDAELALVCAGNLERLLALPAWTDTMTTDAHLGAQPAL